MDVVVVVGAGLIGQAIARRVGPGKKIILADLRQAHADAAVETFLNAGFDAEAVEATGGRFAHLSGRYGTEARFVEDIALATRQLARRQVKWLRPDPRVHWLDVENFDSNEAVVRHVVELTQREAEAALGRS